MDPWALAALAGLSAGLVHALSGPDHVAAVAPLALAERRSRWRTGLLWGIGHSAGVCLVGLLALLLREVLPLDSLSSWSERLVGAVLIVVGLWGLRRASLARLPVPHQHAEEEPGAPRSRQAALWIGALHGLAGSSHLLGLFPALALPSRAASLAYVGGFSVGTVAAMVVFSSTIGLLAAWLTARGQNAYRALLGTASAAAIGVGIFWLTL
ncbi:MAG TPA: sulfite exporter TauE/SafE family protein [Thermoanaerobaculia bacterium]|nr:sulfite exporter TauE/SafE family protein [Thermoanaerobaculia bacterium]